jgi:putative endonuclease
VALAHLTGEGLHLIMRNYRCRHGEIDLIMSHGERLVLVEVRYRRTGGLVNGAQSVDAAKQRRLLAAAEHYLQRNRKHAERGCRFDVVSVSGGASAPVVDWITDAFQA